MVQTHDPMMSGTSLTECDWLSSLEPAALEALVWDILRTWISDWSRGREIWRSPHFDIARFTDLQPDGRCDEVEASHAVFHEECPGVVFLPPVQLVETSPRPCCFCAVEYGGSKRTYCSLVTRDPSYLYL